MKFRTSFRNTKNTLGILVLIILGGIGLYYALDYFVFKHSRIYYLINYQVDLPNSDVIIAKVEHFDYKSNLNINNEYDDRNYVDRIFINKLIQQVEADKIGFHWWPYYTRNFEYTLKSTNESRLFLKYNNDTIYWANYSNYNPIFTSENINVYVRINWYINFSQVPYVSGAYSVIPLNNTYLAIITLEYNFVCGSLCGRWYSMDQYMILDSSLQVICIFIPIIPVVVA